MATLPATFKKDGVVTAASASGICDGAGTLVLASEAAVKQHGLKPLCELVSWAVVGVDPTRMGIGPVPAIQRALAKAKLTLKDVDRVEINEAFAPQVCPLSRSLSAPLALSPSRRLIIILVPEERVRPLLLSSAPSVVGRACGGKWSRDVMPEHGALLTRLPSPLSCQALACAQALGLDMSTFNVHGGAIALGHPLAASGSRITMHLAHAIARGEAKVAVGSACIGGGQGIALVLRKV